MRPSFLRFLGFLSFAVLLLVTVASGCGRTSLEPESLTDGGTGPAACGPSTCPNGCCDGSGVCRTGSDVRACGAAGNRCSDCVANGFNICTSSRVCGRDQPNCNASNCTGCCGTDEGRLRCLSGTDAPACGARGARCVSCANDGRTCDGTTRSCGKAQCNATNCKGCCVGDKCLTGDATSACGTAGAQCGACAAGQVCRLQGEGGGRCEGAAACGPQNCGGCCNAAGQCVAGNDTTACGKQGLRCAACGAAEICVPDGQPNPRTCQRATCNPATCAGCCVGDQCVTDPTVACGIKGQACTLCQPNEICDPSIGVCVPQTSECNAVTCPFGCCVGDICAVGSQNTACGFGGQACTNCANQGPGRVCQAGSCQAQGCGPATCPFGCCDGNTCVTGTANDACGMVGGKVCDDCTLKKQTCQGGVCNDSCGPANCAGCCRPDGTCAPGANNNACGSGGALCSNCTASSSFCNGLVTPRRCNNQQSTCPAPFGNCPGGVSTPVTPAKQNLCSDVTLDALGVACVGGPDSLSCVAALAASPTCSKCLEPFKFPFEQRAGLWACAASFVNGGCRHQTGCAAQCGQTSCNGCSATTENQCYALVSTGNNQCASWWNGAGCANDALQPGELCSQFSYAHYGQWLRSVGDHFCGNGP